MKYPPGFGKGSRQGHRGGSWLNVSLAMHARDAFSGRTFADIDSFVLGFRPCRRA